MLKTKFENNTLTIFLEGKIDSTSAPALEEEINQVRQNCTAGTIILDCDKLEYTTSAGLRVILRLKQEVDDTRLINVHTEIYDIFDMTGFTEMMTVEKAYRVISVEGCEVIGQGANGKIYRIDRDTIVKVFLNADALEEIHRQRELARTAFVLGVPTAIPFDVVRIESGGLGSVYELLNATSYAKLLIKGEKSLDEVAEMSVKMLKLIHSKEVKPGSMPDMKAVALDWADFLKDYLSEDLYTKLHALIDAIPTDMHMMHGDYHLKNVMLQNGESLLIDMDTLCHGHPIFELASIYNAYEGYSVLNHAIVKDFLGINFETASAFWRKSLELYLETDDETILNDVENKAKIIGYTRIMRRTIRRNGLNTEESRALIDYCRSVLTDLLPKTDTLLF
ncbi:MAG: anti-sigma factor antagonist [Flexilinea sp.]|nr:anti-sigma factor antagonist [Flexilinea sp.]